MSSSNMPRTPSLIAATDALTRSAQVVETNVAQIKALFPEAFTEGKIDFDVLKQLLGGDVDEREEKYGLNWHGKRRARQLALTPSTGTLRPCRPCSRPVSQTTDGRWVGNFRITEAAITGAKKNGRDCTRRSFFAVVALAFRSYSSVVAGHRAVCHARHFACYDFSVVTDFFRIADVAFSVEFIAAMTKSYFLAGCKPVIVTPIMLPVPSLR